MLSEEPINQIVGGRGTEGCAYSSQQWRLSAGEVRLFEPGQPVVWSYLPQVPPRHISLVEAEVVQAGLRRVRIRLQDSAGNTLLRWVKPEHLRLKQTTEMLQHYPARQTL